MLKIMFLTMVLAIACGFAADTSSLENSKEGVEDPKEDTLGKLQASVEEKDEEENSQSEGLKRQQNKLPHFPRFSGRPRIVNRPPLNPNHSGGSQRWSPLRLRFSGGQQNQHPLNSKKFGRRQRTPPRNWFSGRQRNVEGRTFLSDGCGGGGKPGCPPAAGDKAIGLFNKAIKDNVCAGCIIGK